MMSKLSAQGSNQNRPVTPKNYQRKRTGQGRNNYDQSRIPRFKITEEFFEEKILEKHITTEVKILEEDIEVAERTVILIEVEK